MIDDPADFSLRGAVARARLHGLKQVNLNNEVGEVLGYDSDSKRWKIKLFGHGDPKLVLRESLIPYEPLPTDICQVCKGPINLGAAPPCSCDPKES